jgi:ligand-binding sensor domain-containing protein
MNNALRYGYKYLCVLLLLLSGACSSKYDSDNSALSNQKVENIKHKKNGLNGAGLTKIPIKGKVINLDTMPAPKVVRAGKPRVVPFNDFTFSVKYPKTISIPKKQVIIIPGKDSFTAPNVYKAQIENYRFVYPEAKTTPPPKMKYGANGYTKHYSKMQGIGGGKMYKIVQDKDENLWFMDHDLIKFDGSHVMRFTHIVNNNKETTHLGLHDIIEDSKGNLWLLRGSHLIPTNRIMKYDGDAIKVITAMDETGNPMAWRYTCMYEDTFGNIWIGNMFTGLLKYESTGQDNPNGKFIHFTKECGLPGGQISCITGSKNGNLWIGTQDAGFYKYEHGSKEYPNGRFMQFSTKDGLSSNHVTSILETSDGKLWIGTYNGGVNIFDGATFSLLTVKEGIPHNLINYLYEDKYYNMWIATHGGGVCKFEEIGSPSVFGKLTYFNADNLLFSNYILSIVEDARGCMWFGSFNGSLTMYDPNSFHHINTLSGMDIEFVMSPIEDQDGNIWFADDRGGGICKFNGKCFSYFTSDQGLSCDSIACLMLDSDNNIWIATTGGGVCKYDGRYFTYYTE